MSLRLPATMPEEAAKALRAPFDPAMVGKLPRVTCSACSKSSSKACEKHSKSKCLGCGNYITSQHIHLDYVGHAAVTDRLLSVDPEWTWEPVAFDASGAPLIVRTEGQAKLWIRLTVCGVSRLGVGVAPGGKDEVEKELISDALRNAAMRFGVALDLWSKQDLHDVTHEAEPVAAPAPTHARDELKARVDLLDPETRDRFVTWKNDQGFPFPWPQTVVDAMHGELDKITADAGGPDAPSPGTEGAPLSSASLLSASPPAGGEPHGYELWSKDDLAAECKERELPFSQTKERMVRELRAWDQAYNPEAVEYDERPF